MWESFCVKEECIAFAGNSRSICPMKTAANSTHFIPRANDDRIQNHCAWLSGSYSLQQCSEASE
ncbi:uncharacterized protein J3R85_021128 [Psidium guajava]|nr:uncharacterized protein J3R85_021128 [Psidium guajava]